MKRYGILLNVLLVGLFTSCNCKIQTRKAPAVEIQLNSTSDYCGGAPPPDELLEALKQPQPMKNTKIVLTKTECKDTLHLQTDATGTVNTRLTPGVYEIRLSSRLHEWRQAKKDPAYNNKVKECIQTYLNKAIQTFQYEGGQQLILIAHLTCDPCRPAE